MKRDKFNDYLSSTFVALISTIGLFMFLGLLGMIIYGILSLSPINKVIIISFIVVFVMFFIAALD